MVVRSWCGRFTRVCGNLGRPSFAIMLRILLSRNTMFGFGQSQNPMTPIFDHHTITNEPHNKQICPENMTKPVGHYTAPRRKITRVGGNLPLVAQFRVLRRPGLLTVRHSFLFPFPFPFFLFFFSSIFFFPFLFFSSLSPFLSSLYLLLSSLSLFPSSPFSLLLPPRTAFEISCVKALI